MRLAGIALLSGTAPALLVGLAVAAAAPAATGPLTMRFEMFGAAGLHLLTNRTTVDTSATGYTVSMELSTRGLASVFVDLESHSQVRGTLVGDIARPVEFTTDIHRNSTELRSRVDYETNGASAWNLPPVQPAQFADLTRGTVDELTAYFNLERRLAKGGGCAAVVPIFDGRHRYDLRFSDAPPKPLPQQMAGALAGPTSACDVQRKDIAGPPDRSNAAYHGTLLYARLPGAERVVPVRMEFDTELGLVKGVLAEVSGPGISLRFPE